MDLVRNNTYDNDIVFCDGHCNSGKSLISKVIEGFDGVEMSKENEIITIIQQMYLLGKIDKNTAIVNMKMWTDRALVYEMVGRDINMRPSDVTTIFTYPYPEKYIKRMTDGERDDVNRRIAKEKPIYQSMTQNALIYQDIYFEAFGDRLKIIYISRDIDDIVDSVVKRKFGSRIGNDPSDIIPTVSYNGESIPYYASEWAQEYLEMNERERVYRWISQENDMVMKAYAKCKYKDNVLFVDFNGFTTFPYTYLIKMGELIGRKQTDMMPMILARERCPR